MLVLKKSIREGQYGTRMEDDLRRAFGGAFDVKPEVIGSLGNEWTRWENYASNAPGVECRNRITASDEGGFWRIRFNKSMFYGEPGKESYRGTWTKDIEVYQDCISPNNPIYKKRGSNR